VPLLCSSTTSGALHGIDIASTSSLEERASADAMPVPALKSMVGHGLGAAAGLTAVAALVCLEAQRLHPTLHLSPDARDPACDLDHVTEGARATDLRAVVLNAFGFGGKNACVVLTRAS
jgi:3-oxoacyl-[acyl-carrier-protein] synthase II